MTGLMRVVHHLAYDAPSTPSSGDLQGHGTGPRDEHDGVITIACRQTYNPDFRAPRAWPGELLLAGMATYIPQFRWRSGTARTLQLVTSSQQ